TIGSDIVCEVTVACVKCDAQSKRLKIYSVIILQNVNMLFDLGQQIQLFFESNLSEITCEKCNLNMVKEIRVLRWPTVLLIHLHKKKDAASTRKPLTLIHLEQYNHRSNVCMSTTSSYCMCTFTSLTSNGKTITFARSKKQWKSSSDTTKSYGEGDQIVSRYCQTVFLILQQIRSPTVSFFNALSKICEVEIDFRDGSCESLSDAIYSIEQDPHCRNLLRVLRMNSISFFECPRCGDKVKSDLYSLNNGIHLFEQTADETFSAKPVLKNLALNNNVCAICSFNIKDDSVLNVSYQQFQTLPSYLLFMFSTITEELLASVVKIDETKFYLLALLITGRYKDSLTIIRLTPENFQLFVKKTYHTGRKCTTIEILDYCETTSCVVGIFQQISQNET
ncbi:unnamed protein product, partial [Didymodactylos carnosus]